MIAADMPLGLVVEDKDAQGNVLSEGVANASGPALGRELELAELLSFIKAQGIENIVDRALPSLPKNIHQPQLGFGKGG